MFTITFSILVLLAELCSMRKPSNISPTPSLKARLSEKSCCGCLHISSTIVSLSFSQLSLGCCTQFVLGWMWRWRWWMWTWGWSWCDVVDLFDIAIAGSCNWEQKLWRTCRAPFSETAKFDWTLILLRTHLLALGHTGTLIICWLTSKTCGFSARQNCQNVSRQNCHCHLICHSLAGKSSNCHWLSGGHWVWLFTPCVVFAFFMSHDCQLVNNYVATRKY